MKTLRKLSLTSKNANKVSEAERLAKVMVSFDFVFLTLVLSKIFSQMNIASQLLQTKQIDLEKALRTLEESREELKKMIEEYHQIKEEVTVVPAKWKVNPK